MKISRNAPCPCGSGKKYKHCCLRLEQAAGEGTGAGAEIRRAAIESRQWLADIVPIPAAFRDDPAARPGAALVMAGGFILQLEVLARPSPEPEEMGAELARQLAEAAERLGARPQRVVVRYAEVAACLGRLLAAGEHMAEVETGSLDELDEAAFALRAEMSGEKTARTFASFPITWAAWGLAESWCADLFRAAAAYFRAAPWKHLWDTQFLEVTGPSGGHWLAGVLGRGEQEFGLSLYGDADDVEYILSSTPRIAAESLRGPVLSLLFEAGSEISREMRKEVATAAWEVAAPDAYPILMAINTPAGGLTRRDAGDLLAAVLAVPAFVQAHREELDQTRETPVFRHPDSGVEIRFLPDEREPTPVPRLGPLGPGGPEGPGARPQAALARDALREDPDDFLEQELEVVWQFEEALTAEGLSRRTVEKHVHNAETFVNFLAGQQGVPLSALHEFDLRVFLYDWFPRKVRTSRNRALAVPGSLRRFFKYLAAEQGIWLPWAWQILKERDFFAARWESFPGGFWWDEEVQAWRAPGWLDLHARLMIHDEEMADGGEWGSTMGRVEAELEGELQRRWLLWRDELLREGLTGFDALECELTERQGAWETAPHPDLDGMTPAEAVAEEQRQTADELNGLEPPV